MIACPQIQLIVFSLGASRGGNTTADILVEEFTLDCGRSRRCMCRGEGNDSVPDVEFGRTTAKEALIDDKSTGTLKKSPYITTFL